jgi:NADPH:quinone reductase
VGGPYFVANLETLAPRGRLLCVGTTAGAKSDIDISIVMHKRLRILGTVLRSRSTCEKADATQRFAAHVFPLVARGLIRPVIDRAYPLEEIRAAHERLESNAAFGKIVLMFP